MRDLFKTTIEITNEKLSCTHIVIIFFNVMFF